MPIEASTVLTKAVIVALARTWEHKLPGYQQEFVKHLSDVYMETSPLHVEARTAIDDIIKALE